METCGIDFEDEAVEMCGIDVEDEAVETCGIDVEDEAVETCGIDVEDEAVETCGGVALQAVASAPLQALAWEACAMASSKSFIRLACAWSGEGAAPHQGHA